MLEKICTETGVVRNISRLCDGVERATRVNPEMVDRVGGTGRKRLRCAPCGSAPVVKPDRPCADAEVNIF